MKKEDFKIEPTEVWWDVYEYWIYKRKTYLFGLIKTNDFKLVIDWDSPLSFKTYEEAQNWIDEKCND
jgi:hypothetical protein